MRRDRPTRTPIVKHLAAAALLVAPLAVAQEAEQKAEREEAEQPEEIVTVVATRTERSVEDVAATVSVTTAEDIERQLARDIADLARFEPGVSVSGTGSRFGLSGFNIRGIGGNRVLTLIDGVRVAETFSFGPFLSARRDYVDVDSLHRAEIARGPISSLYGSDALGGVVALRTKMPQDYLGDRPLTAGFKAGYSSADDSTVGTVHAAFGRQRFTGLVVATRRDGGETENMGVVDGTGPGREKPDPQQATTDNLTAKIAFGTAGHTLTLGVDRYGNETDTRILSDHGTVAFGTTVDERSAADSRDRNRLSLGYRYAGALPFATDVEATLYRQNSDTAQRTFEQRTTPRRMAQSRRRVSFYEQEVRGASVQLHKPFAIGASDHHVVYGIDYAVTDSASLRDGGTFDAAGAPVREFAPLPTRDFPSTEVTQLALFAQDEIALLDGALVLSPGVRYDDFRAKAAADAVYLAGNPGTPQPQNYADSTVSGKVGAVYSFSRHLSIYLRYSEGFRAPPHNDVNIGFSNFVGGYKSISNPQLESERSRGVEAGLRLRQGERNLRLAVFRNRYSNFIESLVLAPQFLASRGVDPADGLLTFQSVNRTSVAIDGVELGGGLHLAAGVRVRVAVAYASGEDSSGAPINSINPLTAVFGLGYAPNERWGVDAVWTLVGAKRAGDIDSATAISPISFGDDSPVAIAPTSGYGIVDLLAHVYIGERTSLDAGLFNIGDKAYRRWADSAAIGADAPRRFTQPGFNFGATLRVAL